MSLGLMTAANEGPDRDSDRISPGAMSNNRMALIPLDELDDVTLAPTSAGNCQFEPDCTALIDNVADLAVMQFGAAFYNEQAQAHSTIFAV